MAVRDGVSAHLRVGDLFYAYQQKNSSGRQMHPFSVKESFASC